MSHSMDTPYSHLSDLMVDECFPELDTRLRRGEHIDARHHRLFNILRDSFPLLSDYYQRFGADLVHGPEEYYYLRPGTGSRQLVRSSKLDELTMVTGQILALFHLDPEQLEGSGWISTDTVYERMRLLLEGDHFCKLLERTRIETQADREKAMDTLRRSIRVLARLGMVRLEGNQTNRLQTQVPLMRFIEPVRTSTSTPEAAHAAMEKLVQDGFISLEPGSPEPENAEPETESPPEQSTSQESEPALSADDALPDESDRAVQPDRAVPLNKEEQEA